MINKTAFFLAPLALAALLSPAACREEPESRAARKAAALESFASLQKELGGALKQAVQEEGFARAIETCRLASPQMEQARSDANLHIRRISERFRNPDHKPDPFEASVLAQWQSDLAAGTRPGVLSADTDQGFRVMKPILIDNGLCLQCHGAPAAMNPDAAREIARLYPDDRATGYAMGDLRGAFSAVWKQ